MVKAPNTPRKDSEEGDRERIADQRQDDTGEDAQRPRTDIARRLDSGIGYLGKAGKQNEQRQRNAFPDKTDHRAERRQIGRTEALDAEPMQHCLDGAVRPHEADQCIADDDAGHEEREHRDALDEGRQPAAGEAEIKRDRQADEKQRRGGHDGRDEREQKIAGAERISEEAGVGRERPAGDRIRSQRRDDCRDCRQQHEDRDEQHGRGDEEKPDGEPSGLISFGSDQGHKDCDQPRAMFGATARYQPSFRAVDQSPSG